MITKWTAIAIVMALGLFLAGGLLRFKAIHDYAYTPARSVTVPRPYPRVGQAVDGLAFSSDGHTLAATDTQSGVTLWTVPSLQCRTRIGSELGARITSLLWIENREILSAITTLPFLTGNKSTLRGWKASGGSLLSLYNMPVDLMVGDKRNYNIYSQQRHIISSSGRLAAAVDVSGNMAMWNVSTDSALFASAAPPLLSVDYPLDFCDIAFSPDGHLLATAYLKNDDTFADAPLNIVLRDARTGSVWKSWQWKNNNMMHFADTSGGNLGWTGLTFSPDGALLATSDDGHVALWDIQTGRLIHLLANGGVGQWGGVKHLVFFAHGRLLAGAGWGDAVPVWNVATGKLLQTFHADGAYVEALAGSPDDKWLATGEQSKSDDGKIKLWDVSHLLH